MLKPGGSTRISNTFNAKKDKCGAHNMVKGDQAMRATNNVHAASDHATIEEEEIMGAADNPEEYRLA
jgi:hypothetical protein